MENKDLVAYYRRLWLFPPDPPARTLPHQLFLDALFKEEEDYSTADWEQKQPDDRRYDLFLDALKKFLES